MDFQTILEVGSITVSLITLTVVGVPYLKKKGVDSQDVLHTAETVEGLVTEGISIAKDVFPNNTIVNIMDFVEKVAVKYTKSAEQLYQSSQLDKDSRNSVVKNQISNILKDLNIPETDAIKEFIDATITETCAVLPHQDEASKTIQAQLEQNNQQLQSQLTTQAQQLQELQNQNASLNQTLANIKTAIPQ